MMEIKELLHYGAAFFIPHPFSGSKNEDLKLE
jgi:hypothetical protein